MRITGSGALEIQAAPEVVDGGLVCIVRCMKGPVWLGDKVSTAAEVDRLEDVEAYLSSISLALRETDLLSAVMTAEVRIDGPIDSSLSAGQWLYAFRTSGSGELGSSLIGDGRWCGGVMDRLLDREVAERYASWFRALADPSRVQILEYLARQGRPLSVGEIVVAVGLAQSTVSQHLRILAEVRFVLADPVGNARHYRVNDRCVQGFPSAADVVLGRPAPSPTGGCR